MDIIVTQRVGVMDSDQPWKRRAFPVPSGMASLFSPMLAAVALTKTRDDRIQLLELLLQRVEIMYLVRVFIYIYIYIYICLVALAVAWSLAGCWVAAGWLLASENWRKAG